MENENISKDTKKDYRANVKDMGKKEFTFLKMQDYGFWPENLPTPYERQKDETVEVFEKRLLLEEKRKELLDKINNLNSKNDETREEIAKLRKTLNETLDFEQTKKEIARIIMKESIERRKEIKRLRELEKQKKSEKWKKHKSENIVYIGNGYSAKLSEKITDIEKLKLFNLPIIETDKDLANTLDIEYKYLRFLAYHRDVIETDHYHRYSIPKKSGGIRAISAPKPTLKKAQRNILELILEKISVSEDAHGFLKNKSVVSNSEKHMIQPDLLINIDIEDFFPSITFVRVRGLFGSFGYSGYISSILAVLCTYCEYMPIDVKGVTKYVKTSDRVLPQGSPASPMITNIICRNLDKKLSLLALKYTCNYSRYADDMSFSFKELPDKEEIQKIIKEISYSVTSENFKINNNKTRYLKQNNRQCITGIIVNNEEKGVAKVWLRRLRAAIHNARKEKEAGALMKEKINEISGMCCWLKSVNEQRYKKILDEAKLVLEN